MTTPILTKPIDEITIADLELLKQEQYPESYHLEYKKEPSWNNRHANKWKSPKPELSDHAKHKFLKEITAFANAGGGTLIIGLDETADRVAGDIFPVLQCEKLASSLKDVIRDSIEPRLPLVEVHAVEIKDDAGVVIIRIAESRLAPHRERIKKECYIRRNDRSYPMTMREIQDLTIRGYNSMAILDNKFAEDKDELEKEVRKATSQNNSPQVFLQINAYPSSDKIWINKIQEVKPYTHGFFIDWIPSGINTYEKPKTSFLLEGEDNVNRPTLVFRGITYEYKFRYTNNDVHDVRYTINRDGSIQFRRRKSEPMLRQDTVLNLLGCALITIEKIKHHVGITNVEYALEIIASATHESEFQLEYWSRLGRDQQSSQALDSKANIPLGSLHFPRMSVGEPSEFGLLLSSVNRDLLNSAGIDDRGVRLEFDIKRQLQN